MARAKKAKPADRRLLKRAEREEREGAELIDQAATRILSRLRELANLPPADGTAAHAPPSKAASEPRFTLRLTEDPVGDGAAGIRDDAELGNVILDMFRDSYSDAGKETFTQAVTRCTVDELAVLELACENESVHEAPRMLERIRHRLLVAQWLDRRIEAQGAEVEQAKKCGGAL